MYANQTGYGVKLETIQSMVNCCYGLDNMCYVFPAGSCIETLSLVHGVILVSDGTL